jgi:hypothetical protein
MALLGLEGALKHYYYYVPGSSNLGWFNYLLGRIIFSAQS